MEFRKSTVFLTFFLTCALVLGSLLLVHPRFTHEEHEKSQAKRRHLVQKLGLTDLCLFTEARYTRHLSQADLHSPFQDHPMAFEHFPSGSVVMPPRHLIKK